MENFPNLPKEIHFQEVQEAHIITLPSFKDKEGILKAAREKDTVTYKGITQDYQLISPKKPCRQEGAGKKYSNS